VTRFSDLSDDALPVVLDDGTNRYLYGLDLIAAIDGSSVATYFLYDGLGSTTELLDEAGAATDAYTYDVFGAVRASTGSSANDWLFTGEQHDADSGLYYLRARYYDPATGRFLSTDPIGAAEPYAYVSNNPVNYVDPSGLCAYGLPCPVEPIVDCITNPLDCVEEAAEEAGETALEVVSPLSTIVGIMDLVPASPWYVEVANAVLTQISIFASDCGTATKIALSLSNAIGLEVGVAGTLLIAPAFAAGGPVGAGAVITATFVIEAGLTTGNAAIIDGCSNIAYADSGRVHGGGPKE
jgi:RHS repeat-associated protein